MSLAMSACSQPTCRPFVRRWAGSRRPSPRGRTYVDNPKGDPLRTGHLTYALFQHDTSRKLDPQAHIHVVVANLTKVAGNWQALFNDELWKNNSLIGSVYHAALRTMVEDLGYQTRQTGKHGQFEIEGVPKAVLTAFSQRREDILAKAADLGRDGRNPELLREITKRTATTRSISRIAMASARNGGAGSGAGV
jgi:conjugative relaxase-like TrwC/TraI family protein